MLPVGFEICQENFVLRKVESVMRKSKRHSHALNVQDEGIKDVGPP